MIALMVIMALLAIALIVVVMLQSGNQTNLGSITGAAETFFGKNKAKTMESKFKRWTVGIAVSMLVCSILFFVFFKYFDSFFKFSQLVFFFVEFFLCLLSVSFEIFTFHIQMLQVIVIGFIHCKISLSHIGSGRSNFLIVSFNQTFYFEYQCLSISYNLKLFFFFSDSEIQNFLKSITKRHGDVYFTATLPNY